MSETK